MYIYDNISLNENSDIGLGINVENIKWAIWSYRVEQNAEKNHNTKLRYKSLETMKESRYLGRALTNQNSNSGRN